MFRFADLHYREVININDGTRLGYIEDAEMTEDGKVLTAIIPGRAPILGIFGKRPEYVVPWDKIKRIGDDIVLTDYEIQLAYNNYARNTFFTKLFK